MATPARTQEGACSYARFGECAAQGGVGGDWLAVTRSDCAGPACIEQDWGNALTSLSSTLDHVTFYA
jgi:hypothetical protein